MAYETWIDEVCRYQEQITAGGVRVRVAQAVGSLKYRAPETVNGDYPRFVNWPASGTFQYAAEGLGRTDHELNMDLLVGQRGSGGGLGELGSMAVPFVAAVRDKFAANVGLKDVDGAVTVEWCHVRSYDIGHLPEFGADHFGIRFVLEVVEKEAVTVSL